MKTTVTRFEDAATIALRVDSAIWNSQKPDQRVKSPSQSGGISGSDPVPMEIGNIEGRQGATQYTQRKKDKARNACFVCHKVECRASNHQVSKASVNNVEAESFQLSDIVVPKLLVTSSVFQSEITISDSDSEN